MDKEDYIRNAEELLRQLTYKPIPTHPTNKYKNKLISLLKTIKTEGGINEVIYRRHLTIVSSIGAVTYETSKELFRILKPLVGKSHYQVQNNQEFIQQIKDIKLRSDEIIMSYDVKALFTSVPIQPALKIIRKLLEDDKELHQRTSMTVNNMTCQLEFCLSSTYFTFQDKYYEQVEGAAMGSPISAIVASGKA